MVEVVAKSDKERIASLETENSNQRADIAEIKEDVKAILAQLNQAKGAWRLAVIVGSAISAIIGYLAGGYQGQH